MKPYFIEEPSVEMLSAKLDQLKSQPDVSSVLVFAADDNGWTAELLDPIVTNADLTVLGGIFPQIIYDGKNYTQGTVLVTFPSVLEWSVVDQLSNLS
ncbi:MAG: histidine kinase, partial [Oceanospirillales bacterium]